MMADTADATMEMGDTGLVAEQDTDNGVIADEEQPDDYGERDDEAGVVGDGAVASEKPSVAPRFIYFLRTPKPDTADVEMRISTLKAEALALREGCDKVLAAAKLALEHRHACREDYDFALAIFKKSRADQDAQLSKLQPMRQTQKDFMDFRSELNEAKRELPASTLDELDQMIADAEFRQSHESLSKREENALIAEIKRLRKARPSVARLEETSARMDVYRDDAATLKATKGELENQLQIVREECNVAKTQMDEKWQIFSQAKANQEAASAEFQRLREMKDEKYKELQAAQGELKQLQDGYYSNRRFGQQVRKLLADGTLEEAMAECSNQVDQAVAQLLEDPASYKMYIGQWEMQRKYAVSQASINLDQSAPAKKGKAKASAQAAAAPQSVDVDSIVKGILAECKGNAPPSKPAPTLPPSTPATNGHSNHAPAGAEENVEPKPAAKPRAAAKSKASKAAAPPPLMEIDDTFVPPTARADASVTLTPAEVKAKLREEQAAKAADAEARRRKADERKAAKAKKAAEQAKQREEAEALKREENEARVRREAEQQRAAAARRKAAAARKADDKTQKGAKKPAAKAEPVMRARPKKNTAYTQVQKFLKSNGPVLAIGGMVLLLSAVIALMLSM